MATSLNEKYVEAELYTKIKNGDHKAFKTFFEAHHQRLFRYLVSRGVSSESAEDLIQQAYVYIWENRSKIDPDKSLRSYLFRIAYTRMLNHFRDEEKYKDDSEVSELESSQFSTDEKLNRRELHQAIEKAIEAMPEKRQHVFRLCFLEEFTYKEAANTMEVSVKTIENHMRLALKDLRNALAWEAENFL
ncbi:RNA polymerase sigma factor [Gracilimonas mengyeensis]|uniref:RNA polymerase sigma factor n=1 Tax=Gracilimonas mengyeensis TaxID=1302730 RepID=A0A521FD94_9BACT|nr:RNA polymerase sigma-70 factor [Gracilimonas mengyeensis]SMO94146.1 RNA polymerase sigma-70 factor, ECF subfamily [Gracilimonas mengyeensis]